MHVNRTCGGFLQTLLQDKLCVMEFCVTVAESFCLHCLILPLLLTASWYLRCTDKSNQRSLLVRDRLWSESGPVTLVLVRRSLDRSSPTRFLTHSKKIWMFFHMFGDWQRARMGGGFWRGPPRSPWWPWWRGAHCHPCPPVLGGPVTSAQPCTS